MHKILRLVFCTCALSVLASAQGDRTAVNGTVTDQSGAPVAGAIIKATQEGTGLARSSVSGTQGSYNLYSLPPGTYDVTVSKSGFNQTRFENVLQTVGQTRTLDAQLSVAGSVQSVSVEDSAPQLDQSDATVEGSVERVQVQKVPINGRNWGTLSVLVPGAIDTGSGTQKSIRFSGQGNDDNNFRLDGNDFTGIQNAAPKSALRLQISSEAIQEFSVDTAGYTVENGGTAGGQVNIVSRSGTNDLHVSLFEYLRNSFFDARSPFNHSPDVQPPFRLNQFGANAGGALKKDKTFYFVNYEGLRQSLGLTQVGFVPSASLRAQVSALQPTLAPFFSSFPIGTSPLVSSNASVAANVNNFVGTASSPVRENSGFVRIDHHFSDTDTAFFRYNVDDGSSTSPLGQLTSVSTVDARLQNGVLEELHVFSPKVINEFRFGFDRNLFHQYQSTGLPFNISIPNLSGLYENYDKVQASTSYDTRDDATWTLGTHSIRAGVEIRRVQINEANSNDGTLAYASFSDFLANHVNTFSDTAPLPDKGLRKTQYFGYVEDIWKLKPTLTATYGVRYNFFGPFSEVNGRNIPFDFAACGGYCARGRSFTEPNYNDLDPRVALAWAPRVFSSNTVLRAGYGIYRGETQLGDQDSPAVNDESSITFQSTAANLLSYPINPALIPTTGLAATPRSMSIYHPDSYVQNWTASVQQNLRGNVVLGLNYVGAKGTDLFQRTYINLLDPVTGIRPLAALGFRSQIDEKMQTGSSIFHAFQATIKRQFSKGLFFSGNYMWSHAIDNNSVGAGEANTAQNVLCTRCDRGNSDYDVRHTGNLSLVYRLPFGTGQHLLSNGRLLNLFVGGWEFSDLFTARTGLPINITVSRAGGAVPYGNTANQRPNLVPGVSIYPPNQNPGFWLNPAAFSIPGAGTFGSLGRNVAVGPSLWQNDIGLDKDFLLTERIRLNFRAEAFNIFNRAQYGNPNANLSSLSSFGSITSLVNSAGLTGTGTPRVLQLAARLSF